MSTQTKNPAEAMQELTATVREMQGEQQVDREALRQHLRSLGRDSVSPRLDGIEETLAELVSAAARRTGSSSTDQGGEELISLLRDLLGRLHAVDATGSSRADAAVVRVAEHAKQQTVAAVRDGVHEGLDVEALGAALRDHLAGQLTESVRALLNEALAGAQQSARAVSADLERQTDRAERLVTRRETLQARELSAWASVGRGASVLAAYGAVGVVLLVLIGIGLAILPGISSMALLPGVLSAVGWAVAVGTFVGSVVVGGGWLQRRVRGWSQ